MRLAKLIIKAHVHVHSAELAIQTSRPDYAYDELDKLRILLTEVIIPMERPTKQTEGS